jgi:hypothetical protein
MTLALLQAIIDELVARRPIEFFNMASFGLKLA